MRLLRGLSLTLFASMSTSVSLSRSAGAASALAVAAASSSLTGLAATHQGPIQVGLTGSIGMGKSTISNHFRKLGFGVFDADAMVHILYGPGGEAVPLIAKHFPDVVVDNAIDRARLAIHVLDDSSGKDNLKLIEGIVHPLVIQKRQQFYEEARRKGELLVVYDIPLLYENRAAYDVDYILVATAAEETQRERCLSRKGMSEEKLKAILAKQVPDETKRARADFLVFTDKLGTYSQARAQTALFLQNIIDANPCKFESWRDKKADPVTAGALRSHFDMVVFDIDQTICPVMGPVSAGLNALLEYADKNMPNSAAKVREEAKSRLILSRIKQENPWMAHDFTDLRRCVLEEIARENDEIDKVEGAMNDFLAARSNIEPYLYSDSLACIDWIRSEGLEVGLLTNGNCDIESYCPELSSKLKFSLSAGDIGATKPSVVPFVAVAQRCGVPCSRILYIGDSYEHDVKGALAAGMGAALLTRPEDGDEERSNDLTKYEDDGKFIKLKSLNPPEILEKIQELL